MDSAGRFVRFGDRLSSILGVHKKIRTTVSSVLVGLLGEWHGFYRFIKKILD